MVAAAPIPLSPRELELLAAFLAAGFDLQTLIDRLNLTPQETLDFAASEPIRARLHALKAFTDLATHLANHRRRRNALLALDEVLTSTTNPIERRRAATAILRFTSAASPSSSSSPSSSPSSFPSSSPSSGGTGVPPVTSDRGDNPRAKRRSPNHRSDVGDTSPESLSAAITDAISRGRSCIPIIREALAPSATINGTTPDLSPQAVTSPAAPRPIIILDSAIALLSRSRIGDDARVDESLLALAPSGEVSEVRIAYTRTDPHRWAIARVEIADKATAEPAPPAASEPIAAPAPHDSS